MELTSPSSPRPRHWRLSIPVSLGAVLLLASLIIAAMSMRSHAGNGSSPSASSAQPAEGTRWMSLGNVDIEGGLTPLYPLQPGRVKSIEAVENEIVKEGQPLFHLEDTLAKIKVKQAEAAVQAAKEQLLVAQERAKQADEQIAAQQLAIEGARNQLKKAQNESERLKNLQKQDLGGSKEQRKNAEIDVESAQLALKGQQKKLTIAQHAKGEAEGMVALAQANIQGKQALLDEARYAVDETIIRAPCEGTPLRIYVSKGQTLGSNPHEPAIEFAANRPLLVRAEVQQEFVGHVHKDQSVVIEDHVTGQECARGRVVSIAGWYAIRRSESPQMLQMNNDARTLECVIKIESTSQELRIGQRVRVQFPH